MTGRDVARQLAGLGGSRGQDGDVGDIPLTPEQLRELTGDEWRRLDMPPGRLTAWYNTLTGAWPVAAPDSTFKWEEGYLFITRYEDWLILYAVGRTTPSMILGGWNMYITHPELDRPSAARAARTLGAWGPYAWAMEMDSEQLPYILFMDQTSEGAERLRRAGFLPAHLVQTPGADRYAWVARSVEIYKAAVRLLKERT